MEKLIHKYLDENYFPYKEANDHYRIYDNDMELETLFEIQPTRLNKTLKDIYGLSFEEVKLFVYTWAVKYFQDIDLDKYWERYIELDKYFGEGTPIETFCLGDYSEARGFDNVAFPMARRIFSSVVAQDLVTVQPLSAPKGMLFYMDFKYDSKKTFKQKLNTLLGKVKIFITRMERKIRNYLHLTNYYNTFVTQEE